MASSCLHAANSICDQIRAAFADQQVPRKEYEHLIASMPGRDPADHAHAAATVARAPVVILTRNLRDFPTSIERARVAVQHPDNYLVELCDAHRDHVMANLVAEMARDHKHPPMAPTQVLSALARAGVPRLARRIEGMTGPSDIALPSDNCTGFSPVKGVPGCFSTCTDSAITELVRTFFVQH